MQAGTITLLYSDFAEVALDGRDGAAPEIVTARLRGRLNHRSKAETRREKAALAVGDRVELSVTGDESVIESREPRRSKLSRRHPRLQHQEQVIAANVDQVMVVAAAERPVFQSRLVDRYLVGASTEGLASLICITKCDLVDASDVPGESYEALGIEVHRLGLGWTEALERLRKEALTGRTTVLVGQSGVGKSTLRNALLPDSAHRSRTGELSEKWKQGRHVTSAAKLEPLPHGGFLVDTPGVRGFGPWQLEERDIARHFPEFRDLQCRFGDCLHAGEPGCGLDEAVAQGKASAERLASLRAIALSLTEER